MLKNVLKTAASFLQTGVCPPNTPVENKKDLENMNHFSSKKFFIVFSSAVMLAFFYFVSVAILFLVPEKSEYIVGYITMFTKAMEIFAIIIASYLGVQAVVDFKYNSNSQSKISSETIKEEVVENLTKNLKEEDYTLK